jgi:hypothetical protein
MIRAIWLRHLRALGIPGGVGLVLLLACAWAFTVLAPDRQAQVDALSSQVRHLRHDLLSDVGDQATAGGAGTDLGRMSPDQAWQSVWDAFPLDSQRLAILKRVTSSAVKMGVSSQSIQYHGAKEPWSEHAGQSLWRQRLTLPVQGRYGDLRAWIGTLLSQPCVSLDTLDIQRADTASDMVSGRVSLSLWWRVEQGRPQ